MPNPTLTSGFRLTVDGSALVFDYGWKRDQDFALQFYNPAADTFADLTGAVVAFDISDHADGASQLSGTLTGTDLPNGLATLVLAATDLASVIFVGGEAMKSFVIGFKTTIGGVGHDVLDDQGNRLFPFRVHWGAA